MVARLGIGATTASAVIFSVLLMSNLVLFTASQGREAHYMQSNAEDSLSDGATVLVGASAANILIEAQGALASAVLNCTTALETTGNDVARLSDFQRSGNLTVNVSASLAEGATTSDNLSMVAPFNGSVAGELDIALVAVASGIYAAAGVSLNRSEVHLVHIPVRLGTLSRDCVFDFYAISGAVSGSIPSNCNYTSIAQILDVASRGPASAAAADGFSFSLGFSVVPGSPCTVSLEVVLEQGKIQGPAGVFSVQVQEQGAVSFAQPAAPQRA